MVRLCGIICCLFAVLASPVGALGFETDTITTSAGDMKITFIGHGTLMFDLGGKIVHVDPVAREADYSKLPKAAIILVTHEHGDHFDINVLKHLRMENTVIVLTETCAKQLDGGTIMRNGDVKTLQGLRIEAVPAYNIKHMRSPGRPFHPKGVGNGYVITFGNKRIYVAGDTENVPEMGQLEQIDLAFLPMNLPYTMTPEMVADAVRSFRPKVLYPYHYGDTDTSKIVDLLKDYKQTEVRIRYMQ